MSGVGDPRSSSFPSAQRLGSVVAARVEEVALEVGRDVFLVGASGSTENRLVKMKLLERLPQQHITSDRLLALQRAVALSPVDA